MTGGGITAGAGFPRRNPAETDRPAVPIAARREITPMELPIKSISASCQVRRPTEEDLPELLALAGDAGSEMGTGGMVTKLRAAGMCMEAGCDMIITNGQRPQDLYRIAAGESVGTRFYGKRR